MAYTPKKVTLTANNLDTITILNTIRQNASYAYQSSIPEVNSWEEVNQVGQLICGNPTNSNQFLYEIVNQIGLVVSRSNSFYNRFNRVKKGFLERGESVEEIFVDLAEVFAYNSEKGHEREHKRYIPDVKSAFHVVNFKVMYPVTIEYSTLELAFRSDSDMFNLIDKITNSTYRAYEYDEYLLVKYLLIKGCTKGYFKPYSVSATDFDDAAGVYRGVSNTMTFPKREFNYAGVRNDTPRERQLIFMDSMYNGQYDSKALAAAFNRSDRNFQGDLTLIDDFTTFDNDRFHNIVEETNMIEEVTEAELTLMKDVTAILVDEEYFQIYDKIYQLKERETASGLYWNYFLHSWKVVSWSPFANGAVFVKDTATIADIEEVTVEITEKRITEQGTAFVLTPQFETPTLANQNVKFIETESMITNMISITPDGTLLIPSNKSSVAVTVNAMVGDKEFTDATNTITSASNVGDTLTFTPQ